LNERRVADTAAAAAAAAADPAADTTPVEEGV
jgi:hypothetical protein